MKALSVLALTCLLHAHCFAAKSAFATVEFDRIAQVALPTSWTYMDKQVAEHLNTSSEAAGRVAGLELSQGDNKILVAATAYDAQGKTLATLRLSVRMEAGSGQAELKELAKQSQASVEAALLPSLNETVTAMLKVRGVNSYRVRGVRIEQNKSLYCIRSSFEGDLGGRRMESDTWLCPLGDRNLKLSTSYDRSSKAVYLPTLEYVWQSLSALPARR